MKKLILLLLFIPLVSLGQDFRKMNFGDTKEQLKEFAEMMMNQSDDDF